MIWTFPPTGERVALIEEGRCPACGAVAKYQGDGWWRCPNSDPHDITFRLAAGVITYEGTLSRTARARRRQRAVTRARG